MTEPQHHVIHLETGYIGTKGSPMGHATPPPAAEPPPVDMAEAVAEQDAPTSEEL